MGTCVPPECTTADDCSEPTPLCVDNMCVPAPPVDAAEVPASWGKHIGGYGWQSVYAVDVAGDGSVYVVGAFEQAIDLGGGPMTPTGTRDLFVAKFLANGAHAWSKHYGATYTTAAEVVLLSNGDLAVSGWFRGSLTLGATTLTSTTDDVFVTRLDASGEPIWAVSGGAPTDLVWDMAVDANDNIIACGSLGTSGIAFGTNLTGTNDTWVVRIAPNGAVTWAKAITTTDPDTLCGVAATQNGDVVVGGNYIGTANFGGTAVTSASNNYYDFYIARLSAAAGSHVWSVSRSGSGSAGVRDVATQGESIVVAGWFYGENAFGGTTMHTAAGNNDAFIARFAATNGAHEFATTMGGAFSDEATHLSIRADGQISAVGKFTGTAEFGNMILNGGNTSDIFAVDAEATTGAITSVKAIGGPSVEQALGLTTTTTALVFVGQFSESISILGQTYAAVSGDSDGYVVRFKR